MNSYIEGSTINILATSASGYVFDEWSNDNNQASRYITADVDNLLEPNFNEAILNGEDEVDISEY